MARIDKTPASSYLTRVDIAYPGNSTAATAVAAQARLDIANMVPTKTGSTPVLTNGVVDYDKAAT